MKFNLSLILAILILLAFFHGPVYSQIRDHAQFCGIGNSAEVYTACCHEMKTIFNFNVFYDWQGNQGYSTALCGVLNSGWSHEYFAGDFDLGQGKVEDSFHCTNLTNHRLQIDVLTGYGSPGKKFDGNWCLNVYYYNENPQRP